MDAESGVALGHRRLSILDLSPLGHQPMASACGRYVVVFNGEIYNFRELRQALEREGAAPRWRGHSDTEVLLAAVTEWGVEDGLRRCNGMFAFALWDRRERVLHLGRDRLGKKPLYYGWMGRTLLFGSELKALRAHPAWHGDVERDVVALFMQHGYVPAPYSIYRGIRKLLPGTVLSLAVEAARPGELPDPRPYWSLREVRARGLAEPSRATEPEVDAELAALLRDAIRQRMVADVPLGAFLSGGIDSSLVTALMQAQSDRPVRTFSIGFEEERYDEAAYAAAVARHLGTDHTELYVSPRDAMEVIPRLSSLYDEPFADPSQIPTFLVSQLARRHVTVALSGDGGDELFGGYERYFILEKRWRRLQRIPRLGRRAAAAALAAPSSRAWDRMSGAVARTLPGRSDRRISAEFISRVVLMLDADADALYRQSVSFADHSAPLVPGAADLATALTAAQGWARGEQFFDRMMYLDQQSYLPDGILVKVDRASMGVGLEVRSPLLDLRVLEFAWSLPLNVRRNECTGKLPLRRLLSRFLPPAMFERPKMGFGVPVGEWVRGPLREWAEAGLDARRLKGEGFLNAPLLRQKWEEHLSGRRNWHFVLWHALIFQAWLQEQGA